MNPILSVAAVPTSAAGGALLAGAAFGVAALRRFAAKPLHPRGAVVEATLSRTGVPEGGRASGVAWIDEPGHDRVIIRMSRAVGLPESWPDVHGLALRVPVGGDDYGDLLLATTGWAGLGRFVLTAARRPTTRPMTTLLPYRSPAGPLLVGARAADGGTRLRLSWSRLRGPWQQFAVVDLAATAGPDAPLRFDPVRRTVPGLENYGWVERLREPAYATARLSRSAGDRPREPSTSV
ncbi:hypothetical protein [Mumia sp. DW29H23]|uniref:hypothetical protein n=1 Tax=Mumia sp. DW29H23 TaxID=3421241 RepID=UPI003D68D3B3